MAGHTSDVHERWRRLGLSLLGRLIRVFIQRLRDFRRSEKYVAHLLKCTANPNHAWGGAGTHDSQTSPSPGLLSDQSESRALVGLVRNPKT